MLLNYCRIALRNLLAHKLYSSINILGLALGLACCLLISLFLRHEFSYDEFFSDADLIYRISPDFAQSASGPERHAAGNVAAFAPVLIRSELDGVEEIARIGGMHALVARDETVFYEDNFRWADNNLFRIFRFDWLQGDAEAALRDPSSVVVSASLARKYFGNEDPMGQTLLLENTWPLTVTGVIADIPQNSHLNADLIVSMDMAWNVLDFNYENNWGFTNFHTYLLLEPGKDIAAVMREIAGAVDSFLADGAGERFGLGPGILSFTPFRIADIHLYSGREGEFKPGGSLGFVLTFSAIAAGLLAIACINFMNLSTARASRRAKEVGMRKTIGASRQELIGQFLGESFLLTFIAFFIALALVEMLLPVFSKVMLRELSFSALAQPGFITFMASIILLTGFVAGSYPAFYLSAFNPIKVFRAQSGGTRRGITVRNVLVVAQFSLAIALVVATVVNYRQMQFARNLDLGFNKDQVVVLWGTHKDGMGRQWPVLKQQLLQHPEITHVTEADMYPGSAGTRRMRIEGGAPGGLTMLDKRVGFGFFETYDIPLVAGRYFREDISTDVFTPPPNVPEGGQRGASYILSEGAVRALGLAPEEAIGRILEMDFSADFSFTVPGPIIGVVKDVHVQSLRNPIQPLVYSVPGPLWGELPSFDIASVRITGNNSAETLAYISQKWKELIPEIPLQYHFLDTDFAALYQDEERQGQLFTFFAVLTILIACLGLFGLASFSVEKRIKEIGVRKVMGGSIWSIVVLLTNDFSRLVLIANVLAWPVAYFAMTRWLENFAYRIDLTPLIFIGSGLIALCIAWVTVGGTAAKAASAKPVLALRYE